MLIFFVSRKKISSKEKLNENFQTGIFLVFLVRRLKEFGNFTANAHEFIYIGIHDLLANLHAINEPNVNLKFYSFFISLCVFVFIGFKYYT